jgi:hypothetical protein
MIGGHQGLTFRCAERAAAALLPHTPRWDGFLGGTSLKAPESVFGLAQGRVKSFILPITI